MIGPGKYDAEATMVMERTKAQGVIVIVIGGNQGRGLLVSGDMGGDDAPAIAPESRRRPDRRRWATTGRREPHMTTTTKPNLNALLDQAERFARGILVGTEAELTPLFHLITANDQNVLVSTPFSGDSPEEVDFCKDAAAAAVRRLIREHKAIAYLFLSEAWMTQRKKYIPGISQRPSESDDRVEIVLATAHSADEHQSRRWRIKRDGPKCIDLVLEQTEGEQWSGTGRFDGLLQPARKAS